MGTNQRRFAARNYCRRTESCHTKVREAAALSRKLDSATSTRLVAIQCRLRDRTAASIVCPGGARRAPEAAKCARAVCDDSPWPEVQRFLRDLERFFELAELFFLDFFAAAFFFGRGFAFAAGLRFGFGALGFRGLGLGADDGGIEGEPGRSLTMTSSSVSSKRPSSFSPPSLSSNCEYSLSSPLSCSQAIIPP
jgi:hypothetical protein